ncbi:MAG: glucosidase [Planctomycetota bacterium]
MQIKTPEHQRLIDSEERRADWKQWGPYVSERAWGTVREDYSANGDAWNFFPHDHARSRAYRWNEDGLGGFCNRFQNVCLAVAFWNGKDPFLKERLFGLNGPEGNHGEDVKEYYFYLDGTPTHSYMKMLYKYPQVEYPYQRLVDENRHRDRHALEFELIDALPDTFAESRYFDIFIEYAKAGQEDILCRIHAINRGPDAAPLHVLPHLWFRNTWSWGYGGHRPEITRYVDNAATFHHRHLGDRYWYVSGGAGHSGAPRLYFTENETNTERLFGYPNGSPYVKDGIHEAVVHGRLDRVNPTERGSKVAAHFQAMVAPGEEYTVCVRFAKTPHAHPFGDFDDVFRQRIREADAFYDSFQNLRLTDEEKMVQRQAFAGLCWTKQFYHYSVELWLDGDPAGPPPPPNRYSGRNADWPHVYNLDVLAVPDKWEYPWCAAWDVAFNMIPTAIIDPEWAKRQLILQLREWYMHPNGQIAAYEWNFSDVNPPVHAWAVWRVYKIDRKITGTADTQFLEQAFHKLLLNFTWWVNKVDAQGRNIFQGGFLGMDNIGVFDRSAPLPTGGYLEQADGTAWMGMYCLNMLAIALELARTKPAYEDVATKFFEHFIYIANAINSECGEVGLWDEEEGFFYDMIQMPDGGSIRVKVRSFVGLIPLFAVETRSGRARFSPPFSPTHGVVHQVSPQPRQKHRFLDGDRGRRSASPHHRRPQETRTRTPMHARSRGILLRLRPAILVQKAWRIPVRMPFEWLVLHGGIRTGGIVSRHFRRELQLARAHLVSRQLPHDRVAPKVPSLLRRFLEGRTPHPFEPVGKPLRGRQRDQSTVDSHFPRGSIPWRSAGRLRRRRALPKRSPLARPHPLLRILPCRDRRRARGKPPNWLDRARRQVAAAMPWLHPLFEHRAGGRTGRLIRTR